MAVPVVPDGPSDAHAVQPGPGPENTVVSEIPPVHPMIERANQAYFRDLPEILKTHYRQRVAYHGDQRIAFGRSKTLLVQDCLRRGIPRGEFIVYSVEPDARDEEELDGKTR